MSACSFDVTGLRGIVGHRGGLIDIAVYPESVVVQVGDTAEGARAVGGCQYESALSHGRRNGNDDVAGLNDVARFIA